jgi:nucleoid DNA-binding protein
MAKRVEAIAAYCPRIKEQVTISLDTVAEDIKGKSSFSKGDVKGLVTCLCESIASYLRAGHRVKIKGLGLFSPSIKLDGKFNIGVRIDTKLKTDIGEPEFFGTIKNKSMIGKSPEDLVELWNKEHPNDPVE